jgi:hypothetical protein
MEPFSSAFINGHLPIEAVGVGPCYPVLTIPAHDPYGWFV